MTELNAGTVCLFAGAAIVALACIAYTVAAIRNDRREKLNKELSWGDDND